MPSFTLKRGRGEVNWGGDSCSCMGTDPGELLLSFRSSESCFLPTYVFSCGRLPIEEDFYTRPEKKKKWIAMGICRATRTGRDKTWVY